MPIRRAGSAIASEWSAGSSRPGFALRLIEQPRRLGETCINAMRTYPIRDAGGTLYAFEIRAQLIGWKVRRALRDIDGVSDVRPRRWWVGSPEIHIRFTYREREYIVWEPFGDNSRWWIGPDDTDSPHEDVEDLERAIASR